MLAGRFTPTKLQHGSEYVSIAAFVPQQQQEMRSFLRSVAAILYEGHPESTEGTA